MTIALAILFGLLGIAIGSFLNVCIDRLPTKKSLAYPASHCDACQHPLSPQDNIPIFSYIWLRGKCRYCGAHIPLRVLLVEIASGVLFTGLFLKFGLTPDFPVITLYSCILLVLAVIDLEQGLLLNVIVYPTMGIAILINIFLPNIILNNYAPHIGILNGLLGGAIGFVILFLPAIISKTGMGWGDVKMAGMIGLMTGFPNVFAAIIGGIVLGGLVAIFLILFRKKGRKDAIPFGPFLTLAALVTLLWGSAIMHWYLKLVY